MLQETLNIQKEGMETLSEERQVVLPQTSLEIITNYFYPHRQKPKFLQACGYGET